MNKITNTQILQWIAEESLKEDTLFEVVSSIEAASPYTDNNNLGVSLHDTLEGIHFQLKRIADSLQK